MKMIDHLRQSGLAGHIVDGPKGPGGIIKAGVIALAHASDAAIVIARIAIAIFPVSISTPQSPGAIIAECGP